MPGAIALPLQSGLDAVVGRYAEHGPLAAAFLANLLATFGDKGQLVVITLATRYDAKNVFVGAMGAFALWSALEVAFGQYVVSILPAGVVTLLTGGCSSSSGSGPLDRRSRGSATVTCRSP
ncbi:hypothetical protein SY89_01552 [Halolamina pelagica]|uniref:GDT1 family protein n=1 Tax=Halolamina pelagica TaxID=699431 RepID=A0A0P7GB65_9EURY|nr:TMEM165/GDT1 family protein [Halolamina pelagica]KPN30812.1 hypothetical protein SY89_01552 [Halolamina pelagica]